MADKVSSNGFYGRAQADAAFRERIEAVKAKPLSELVGRIVKLKKVGREHVGLCPFHGEKTPSFTVTDRAGLFFCFGCGATGDHLSFVAKMDRISIRKALEFLEQDAGFQSLPMQPLTPKPADHNLAAARFMWQRRRAPLSGTVVERYLTSRQLGGPLPGCIGYLPPRGEHGHAMITAMGLDPVAIDAVHLTRLSNDGKKLGRVIVGPARGHPIVLRPFTTQELLHIVEGIETGLRVARWVPDAAVWAAGSASLLPGLATAVPEGVRVEVIAELDRAGILHSESLVRELRRAGRRQSFVVEWK